MCVNRLDFKFLCLYKVNQWSFVWNEKLVQIPTPDYGEAPTDYDLNNNDDNDNHTPQSFNKTHIRNNMSDAMKEISKDINFRAKQ